MGRVKNMRWSQAQGAGVVTKSLIAVSALAYFFQQSDLTVTVQYANQPFLVG